LGPSTKIGGGMEVIDIKNKTISSLGKAGTTPPVGGLGRIESDSSDIHYYVTDNPAGKVYVKSSSRKNRTARSIKLL
jgi:hypothetical protein